MVLYVCIVAAWFLGSVPIGILTGKFLASQVPNFDPTDPEPSAATLPSSQASLA